MSSFFSHAASGVSAVTLCLLLFLVCLAPSKSSSLLCPRATQIDGLASSLLQPLACRTQSNRVHVEISDMLVEVTAFVTVSAEPGAAFCHVRTEVALREDVGFRRAMEIALEQRKTPNAESEPLEKPLSCEAVVDNEDAIVERKCSAPAPVVASQECNVSIVCRQLLHCTGGGCQFSYVGLKETGGTAANDQILTLTWHVSDARGPIRSLLVEVASHKRRTADGELAVTPKELEGLRIHYVPRTRWQHLAEASRLTISAPHDGSEAYSVDFWSPTAATRPEAAQRTVAIALMPRREHNYKCGLEFYRSARLAVDAVLEQLNDNDYVYISSPMAHAMLQLAQPVPLVREVLRNNAGNTSMLCDPGLVSATTAGHHGDYFGISVLVQTYILTPIMEGCRSQGGPDDVILLVEDAFSHRAVTPGGDKTRRAYGAMLAHALQLMWSGVRARVSLFYFHDRSQWHAANADFFVRPAGFPAAFVVPGGAPTPGSTSKRCISSVLRHILSRTRVTATAAANDTGDLHFDEPFVTSSPASGPGRSPPPPQEQQCSRSVDRHYATVTASKLRTLRCLSSYHWRVRSVAVASTAAAIALPSHLKQLCSAMSDHGAPQLLRTENQRATQHAAAKHVASSAADVHLAIRLSRLGQYDKLSDWQYCLQGRPAGRRSSAHAPPPSTASHRVRLYDMLARSLMHDFLTPSSVYYHVICGHTFYAHFESNFAPSCPLHTEFNSSWVRNVGPQEQCLAGLAKAMLGDIVGHAIEELKEPSWLMAPPEPELVSCVEERLGLPQIPELGPLRHLAENAFSNVYNTSMVYRSHHVGLIVHNENFYRDHITSESALLTGLLYPHLQHCVPDPALMLSYLLRDFTEMPVNLAGVGTWIPHRYCPNVCRPDARNVSTNYWPREASSTGYEGLVVSKEMPGSGQAMLSAAPWTLILAISTGGLLNAASVAV